MIHPQVQWTSPAPMWPELADTTLTPDRTKFRRPTILRFATDDFMVEFLQILDNAPQRLGDWEAVWETWRQPAPIPLPAESPPALTHQVHNLNLGLTAPDNGSTPALDQAGKVPESLPITLYQTAQQRFYLISACLVCRIPGLPDRMLDINRGEKATFVIRRVVRPQVEGEENGSGPPTSGNLGEFDEYAFVLTPQGERWQRLGRVTEAKTRTLLLGEDQLPLFGVTYPESDCRKRRLLAGLIPVGKRETYIGSPVAVEDDGAEDDAAAQKPMDPRLALFISQVVQPWRSVVEGETRAWERLGLAEVTWRMNKTDFQSAVKSSLLGEEVTELEADELKVEYWHIRRQTDQQVQMASWYALLDFAEFLQTHLESVWKVLTGESDGHLTDKEQALVRELREASSGAIELAQALVNIEGFGDQLEGANLAFDDSSEDIDGDIDINGPNLFFPGETEGTGWFAGSLPSPLPTFLLTDVADLITTMEDTVAAALEKSSDPVMTAPPLPLSAQQPDTDVGDPGWFIIRCVYERTHCIHNPPVVLSEASVPFQLASFFDPNGPARPIRIPLPLDTSPAGLRKFAKNTAFVMPDILACQIGQIRDITLADLVLSVLPWPFHKALPKPKDTDCKKTGVNAGMVCSLSIPIVTLCALILLIIIVTLFEQLFHWIQFFIVCFKIPGLKAKGNT